MSDYNFEPNYKKYWDKKTTAEQAAALVLGIDPNLLAKAAILHEKGLGSGVGASERNGITEQDVQLWDKIVRFCHYDLYPPGRDVGERLPAYMAINVIKAAKELAAFWYSDRVKGDKTQF